MDRFGSARDDGQTGHHQNAHHRRADLRKLAAGKTIEQILEVPPQLTRETIQTALAFAEEALRAAVIYPVVEALA